MEASAIKHMGAAGAHGRSPLLRLQSDERLVTLVRRGNQHAFEALVARYQARLLAFCRHMLSSREDAEDVLQEVFTAAFNAMLADERPINVRPWLYRIARNRSLNHLRRVQAIGVDSMDVHLSEGGISTAEKVHRREDFRLFVADVQELPETQKTALLLREIDALSYEQIAEAMDNTVPSVKSLLVRARVSLAEAAEARLLDCNLVRMDLAEVSEGLRRMSPPVRRHLRTCTECAVFRKQLVNTNRALAALMPAGPLLLLKKTLLAHIGTTAAASGGSVAAGSTFGGAVQLGIGATAQKAAAGLAAAAIMTAGAVEVKQVTTARVASTDAVVVAAAPTPATTSPSTETSSTASSPTAPVLEDSPLAPPPPLAVAGDLDAGGDQREAEQVAADVTDAEKAEPDADAGVAAGAESAGKPDQAGPPLTVARTQPPTSPTTTHTHPPPSLLGEKTTPLGAPGVTAPQTTPAQTQVIVHSAPAALGMPGTGTGAVGPAGPKASPVLAAPSLPVTGPFEGVVEPEPELVVSAPAPVTESTPSAEPTSPAEPVVEGQETPGIEPAEELSAVSEPVAAPVQRAPVEPDPQLEAAPAPEPADTPQSETATTTAVGPAPAPETEPAPEAPVEAAPPPADPAS